MSIDPRTLVAYAKVLAWNGEGDKAAIVMRNAQRMMDVLPEKVDEGEVAAPVNDMNFAKQVEEAVHTHELKSKKNPYLSALPKTNWMYEDPDLKGVNYSLPTEK